MRKFIIILLSSLSLWSCGPNLESKTSTPSEISSDSTTSVTASQQSTVDIQVMKYEDVLSAIKSSTQDYVLVNFWATWCVPCVKEMPYFFKIKDNTAWSKVEFMFVNLDEARLKDTKVSEFLLSNNYTQARHLLLDDNARQHEWIDAFSPEWSGSLPTTLLYQKGQLIAIHEGIFTEEELKSFLSQHIQ